MTSILDEQNYQRAIESQVNIRETQSVDAETELRAMFGAQDMQGHYGMNISDYDALGLKQADLPPQTFSAQYLKPGSKPLAGYDPASGERLIPGYTVDPYIDPVDDATVKSTVGSAFDTFMDSLSQPSIPVQGVDPYIDPESDGDSQFSAEMKDAFTWTADDLTGEAWAQRMAKYGYYFQNWREGVGDDLKNHVLDLTADIAVAFGAPEEDMVRSDPADTAPRLGGANDLARDFTVFGLQFFGALKALQGTVGSATTLWGTFGQSAVAGAVADFMNDPRTDSLTDAVISLYGEEQVIANHAQSTPVPGAPVQSTPADPALMDAQSSAPQWLQDMSPRAMYEENPLLARAMLSAEGVLLGTGIEGVINRKAVGGAVSNQAQAFKRMIQRNIARADQIEQIGVDRLRRATSQLNAGVDPDGIRGLVEIFTARILKGVDKLSPQMREEFIASGAMPQQIDEAWGHALAVAERAEAKASAEVGAPQGNTVADIIENPDRATEPMASPKPIAEMTPEERVSYGQQYDVDLGLTPIEIVDEGIE